jgi:hypothetical protein
MFLAIDTGETVVLRSRDGQTELDALDLMVMLVSAETDQMLKRVLSSLEHAPRITIDDLTIAREHWHIRVSNMPFLTARDRAAEFRSVREWAQHHDGSVFEHLEGVHILQVADDLLDRFTLSRHAVRLNCGAHTNEA